MSVTKMFCNCSNHLFQLGSSQDFRNFEFKIATLNYITATSKIPKIQLKFYLLHSFGNCILIFYSHSIFFNLTLNYFYSARRH